MIRSAPLPKRRTRPRMGVREPEKRTFPVHQAFVRRHQCCVPGCSTGTVIQFAHVKSRGAGGGDWFGVSLCLVHHAEQHKIGIITFGRKYRIDLLGIAEAFCRATTDKALRLFLREKADYVV